MSNEDETQQPGGAALIADLYHRVRFMEQNLPPRVQNLEVAVSEIREEFRGMRHENLAAAKDNQDALNSFRATLERHEADQSTRAISHDQNEREVNKTLQALGRKITFASGAFWAGTVLLGFAAYHWQRIEPILEAATGVMK